MIVIIVSIALLVCLVIVAINCLNCFQKPKFQSFQNRESTRAQNNPSFTVDITDSQGNEQVAIEALPDILAKTSAATPLRPKIICSERGKQDATLSLVSVQRSFPREQIQYLNEIETGWFGKVLDSEASKIVSGSVKSRVMVKMLKDDATKFEQKQFLDEVLAFRCLEHANLLGLLGQCIETSPFLILLEFAPHGDLKTFLIQHRLEAEAMIKRHRLLGFAVDAAAGVACLHRHGYIHNDLAARNCVIMSDYSVKIGDYGISDVLFREDYMVSGPDLLPIRWMAPESLIQSQGVWTAQPGDKLSDMWAFGILLWEIFSFGDRPYDMLTDEAVLQGVVLDRCLRPAELDTRLNDKDKLWQLMGQCWQDPTQRIQIEQVYHELDRLTSARRDTLEVSIDFDQRWSELPPNKRAPSSGSRIALAGSFAGSTNTERSSTASTIPESVPDFTLSSESSAEHIAEGPPVPFVTTANGGGDTEMVGTREEELRTSQSEHLGSGDTEMTDSGEKSLESVDESGNQIVNLTPVKPVVVASSTPSGPTQSDSSEFFSPLTSTPASLYATASEETQSASKETSLANNDTTIQSINDDTETEEKNENQQLTGDFSDFVRTSPTIGHPDFGDFESSLTPTTVDSSNEKVHTPTGSADFTDFEGAGDNFSTAKLGNISDAQTQEKLVEESISKELEAPQSLSLEFESLNMDSFAEGKPGDTSSPFADQANSQDTDLVTSVTAPSLESDPAEKIETFNSGPLLDEDIDQLVQLPDVSLGNISVPSLPSEPALLLPVETSAVQPPQAMAFTDVPEPQQSLVQDLESLPVPQVPEKSADSLMAALGESLESHPISLLESPQELQEPEGNLLGDIPGFEKMPAGSNAASSSMVEWDLLGLDADPTPASPSPDIAKESSSTSEPGQATLIDLL